MELELSTPTPTQGHTTVGKLPETATVLERASVRVAVTEEAAPAACAITACPNVASRSDGRCARHSRIQLTLAEAGRRASEKLQRNQDVYADIHLEAAVAAALKGDALPAQWALERGGSVRPAPKEAAGQHNGPNIVVQVGVALPGLGI